MGIGQPDRVPPPAPRQFTIADSDHGSHAELAAAIRNCIRWHNVNTRYADVLALERKPRATLLGEAPGHLSQPRVRTA